jgi:hypothetical protein
MYHLEFTPKSYELKFEYVQVSKPTSFLKTHSFWGQSIPKDQITKIINIFFGNEDGVQIQCLEDFTWNNTVIKVTSAKSDTKNAVTH